MMIEDINRILKSCTLCPHECGADRTKGKEGICGMGSVPEIASYGPHYGEEPELVGRTASGTIFLSGCNLLCKFCQNFAISHEKNGVEFSIKEVTSIILNLQDIGACNINLVTPTHFSPQLITAIEGAKAEGLTIPVVYNTNGYDKVDTLKMWEGIVDIYMPDIKFADSGKSALYSNADDYFEYASSAVLEMHRQVGDLVIKNGRAKRGLLVRHLVLPNGQSDTIDIINFVTENLGTNSYFNLMDQYRPVYRAYMYPKISSGVSTEEFSRYVEYAKYKGFTRPDYLYFQ
jgi:putative pyruvate formate lyase activating enzyme